MTSPQELSPAANREEEVDFDSFIHRSFLREFSGPTIIDALDHMAAAGGISDHDLGRISVMRVWATTKATTRQPEPSTYQAFCTRSQRLESAINAMVSGTANRTQTLAVLTDCGLQDEGGGYRANQLRAFAKSLPPTPMAKQNLQTSLRHETDRLLLEMNGPLLAACDGNAYLSEVLAETCLAKYCSRRRCEYCKVNTQCMAEGCVQTPIRTGFPLDWQSVTPHKKTFRCVPGLHLCNAHGQTLLTQFKPKATPAGGQSPTKRQRTCSHQLKLDDGRVVHNIWQ